jgi:hypothetical protein
MREKAEKKVSSTGIQGRAQLTWQEEESSEINRWGLVSC